MGLRVVEKKSLRRWVILWLGELGRSRARRGSLVWGEVIGADLRCGVGEFRAGEAVALWSVSGAERAVRRLCGAILEAVAGVSSFHDRRARAGSRPRASRFRGAGACWRSCVEARAQKRGP